MEKEYGHNFKNYSPHSDNKKNILEILICLIQTKDEYLKIHSENVANYIVLLGKELRLNNKDLELIKIGGILHDIGKLGIPNYILRKNTSLTELEFEIMKKHTIIGEELLPNDGYEIIKQIIRSHHERMDGTGYPDQLKGNEIPYFVRMLSISDTFDAITTQRTYNKRKTLEEAIEELYNSANQQLDPDLEKYLFMQ